MRMCEKGHEIPNNVLVCVMCAEQNSEQAMYELQLGFLRKVVDGSDRNYTLRVTKSPNHHVLQYTSYTRTFCGCELPVRHAIAYQPYSPEVLGKVCAGCRAAIANAVEDALAS